MSIKEDSHDVTMMTVECVIKDMRDLADKVSVSLPVVMNVVKQLEYRRRTDVMVDAMRKREYESIRLHDALEDAAKIIYRGLSLENPSS